jgi:membrane-bound lytic murein transglycosylase MltF
MGTVSLIPIKEKTEWMEILRGKFLKRITLTTLQCTFSVKFDQSFFIQLSKGLLGYKVQKSIKTTITDKIHPKIEVKFYLAITL